MANKKNACLKFEVNICEGSKGVHLQNKPRMHHHLLSSAAELGSTSNLSITNRLFVQIMTGNIIM